MRSSDAEPVSDGVAKRIFHRKGKGQNLEAPLAEQYQQFFGAELSDVRVHKDMESFKLNRDVGALAFAAGRDIFLSDQLSGGNSVDLKGVLAHELAHVVQQSTLHASASSIFMQRIPARAGEIPVQVASTDAASLYRDSMALIVASQQTPGGLWVQSGAVTGGYIVESGESIIYRDGLLGPCVDDPDSIAPGVYRAVASAPSGYVIEQLFERMSGELVWRDSDLVFSRSGAVTAQYLVKPHARSELSGGSADTPPERARDRVPEWAWNQWQAARILLQERVTESEDAEDTQPLPESLTLLPGPAVRVVVAGRTRMLPVLPMQPSENGQILLQRAINMVALYAIPEGRESIEGLATTAPDWALRNVQWVRDRVEEDRHRYQQLAQIEAERGLGVDATPATLEQRTAERRQLFEHAVGLPSAMHIGYRRAEDLYVLILELGDRTARLTLQQDEDPLRLYTRVLAQGRQLSGLTESDSSSAHLLRGHQAPWPLAIENIGSEVAVSGYAHWFTVHITPPLSLAIMPTLGASWHIFPIQENDETASLGSRCSAATGAVAADELTASLAERPSAIAEDANGTIEQTLVVVAAEAIGAVGDTISYGMDYLSELGSGDRGIVFPTTGRYIVHVSVFPRLSRADAEHFGIEANDLPAPSVAVFPITVESASDRAEHIAAEGTEAEVEGTVAGLQTRLAELELLLDQSETEESREEVLEEIGDIERRLRGLRLQTDLFGYLTRRFASVREQVETLRPLINYLETHSDQQLTDRAGMSATVLDLWKGMELQWRAQRIEGHRLPPLEHWVRQQVRDLERANAATTRQRTSLAEHNFEAAQRLPGAFVAQDGRQLPLQLAVREVPAEDDDRTELTLLDVSEVGAPDSGAQARQFYASASGSSAAIKRAAFELLIQNYTQNCGYGRGTLYLARPVFWPEEVGLPEHWVIDRHPGPSERWQERLENIANAAMLAGLILSGPVGIIVGVAGAVASAGAAVIRLERRLAQGTLRVDADSFSAVIDILSAPIAGLTALAALRRAGHIVVTGERLSGLIELGEGAERFIGAVQVGQQLVLLPRQIDADLASLQHLSGHERRRRLLDLWMGYAQQFHGLTQTLTSVIAPEHHVDSSDTDTTAGSDVEHLADALPEVDAIEPITDAAAMGADDHAVVADSLPPAEDSSDLEQATESADLSSDDAAAQAAALALAEDTSTPTVDSDVEPEAGASDTSSPETAVVPASEAPTSAPNSEATGQDVTRPLYASDGRFVDPILEAAYQRYHQSRSKPLERERWLNHIGSSPVLSERVAAALGPDWRARRSGRRVVHRASAGPVTTSEIPAGRRRQRMEEIAMWRAAFRHLRDAYPSSGDPRGTAMSDAERSAAIARLESLMDAYEARTLSREEWREFDRLSRRLRRDRFLRPTLSGISHGTEQIGALAGDLHIRETTGANRIYPTHLTEAGTSGTVDGLYLQRDSRSTATRDLDIYHVAEFKGNTARLGGRVIDGEFYGQGHPRYLLETLRDMHTSGQIDTPTFRRLLEAWRDGRLRYVEVRTPVPDGAYPTIDRVESREFDIPAPADIAGLIAALAPSTTT